MVYAEAHTASAALEKFDVSRSTFYSWKKEMEEGYIKPEREAFYHKLNHKEVYQFVQQNTELTTAEIADHFGNVTSEAVRICLRKLGFSLKKKFLYSERDEQKWQEYLEKIKNYQKEQIIYLDESGLLRTWNKTDAG